MGKGRFPSIETLARRDHERGCRNEPPWPYLTISHRSEIAIQDRLKWRRDYSDGGFIRALFSHRWDDLRAANNAEIRRLIRLLRRERAR